MPYNKNILGFMQLIDLRYIELLASQVPKNGIIVEIGSCMGRSSYCWAASADPSVTVYCIDIFPEFQYIKHNISDDKCKELGIPKQGIYNCFEAFKENTKDCLNIKMIQGNSPYDIKYDQSPIDLFFLDGSHTNPNDWDNIEYFIKYINQGGIIAGHDYSIEEFPDVVENVHKLEKIFNKRARFYEYSSIWSIHL
jgi:predicted O-methyltransferase YrrM